VLFSELLFRRHRFALHIKSDPATSAKPREAPDDPTPPGTPSTGMERRNEGKKERERERKKEREEERKKERRKERKKERNKEREK